MLLAVSPHSYLGTDLSEYLSALVIAVLEGCVERCYQCVVVLVVSQLVVAFVSIVQRFVDTDEPSGVDTLHGFRRQCIWGVELSHMTYSALFVSAAR